MINYSAADQQWFEREVGGSLTISPAELVYLSEQADLAHDLAQLDAMCAAPTPRYIPDQREPLARLQAQQKVQGLNHRPPVQGRTIPLSTVAFIFLCGLFLSAVLLIELVGRSM